MNCPICNSQIDFLTEKKDRFGQAYQYIICKKCRFLFERDMVINLPVLQEKVKKLYGTDYFEHTDEGWQKRGDGFLHIFKKVLRAYRFFTGKKMVTILDYGAGNGYLASKLANYAVVYYYDTYEKPTFEGKYTIIETLVRSDLAYAVELVEHFVDMKEWDFLETVSPGVFVFTTGIHDNIPSKDLSGWEYLNPNAGHMALYSTQSLYLLAKKYGYVYWFFPNISCHMFMKNKFLSRFNFVALEYFVYSIFRKTKHIIKR